MAYIMHVNFKMNVEADITSYHYDNIPKQKTVIFHGCKNDYFQMKNCDIFLPFAQNIDRVYTIEPPH